MHVISSLGDCDSTMTSFSTTVGTFSKGKHSVTYLYRKIIDKMELQVLYCLCKSFHGVTLAEDLSFVWQISYRTQSANDDK